MKKYFTCLALLCILVWESSAADLEFFSDSYECYPGMPVSLILRITADKAVDRPELPDVEGLTFEAQGETRYEQRSLGRGGSSRNVTMEYSWRVFPLAAGKKILPSFTIPVDGELLETPVLEYKVKEPGPIEGFHVFLESDGHTLFPSVPARLTLKWLFSAEVNRPEFTLPFLDQMDLKVQDLPPPSRNSADIFQFTVNGRRMYASQSAEIYEGKQYASLNISWDLYPEIEGKLELDPVYISFQYAVLDQNGRKKYLPAVIPSNSLSLNVETLPLEISSFPGGILVAEDRLEIVPALDQKRVYPGDPLELSLRFKGLVNPQLTDFKGISGMDALQGIADADNATSHADIQGNDFIYSQTIRMKKSGLLQFPSLTFPYYSLKSGRVEIFRTEPLDLEVLQLSDETVRRNPVQTEAPLDEAEHPLGNITLAGNKRIPESPRMAGILYKKRWFVTLFLISILWICLFLPRIPGIQRTLSTRKEHKELVSNLSLLQGDYTKNEVENAYRFLSAWLAKQFPRNEYPGGWEEALTVDTANQLVRILESLEEYLWNPKSSSDMNLPDDCTDLLKQILREKKGKAS